MCRSRRPMHAQTPHNQARSHTLAAGTARVCCVQTIGQHAGILPLKLHNLTGNLYTPLTQQLKAAVSEECWYVRGTSADADGRFARASHARVFLARPSSHMPKRHGDCHPFKNVPCAACLAVDVAQATSTRWIPWLAAYAGTSVVLSEIIEEAFRYGSHAAGTTGSQPG